MQRHRVKAKAKGATEAEVSHTASFSRSLLRTLCYMAFSERTRIVMLAPLFCQRDGAVHLLSSLLRLQFLDEKSASRVMKLAHEQQDEEDAPERYVSLMMMHCTAIPPP